MIDETIKSIAAKMQVSPEDLLKNFSYIGMNKSLEDFVTKEEKEMLISHLQRKNKITKRRLVFQKKTRSTLNVLGIGGQNKKISIEVRKSQSYVRYNTKDKINSDSISLFIKNKEKDKIKNVNSLSKVSINASLFDKKNIQKNSFCKEETKKMHSDFLSKNRKEIIKSDLSSCNLQDENFWNHENDSDSLYKNFSSFSNINFDSKEKKDVEKVLDNAKTDVKISDVKEVFKNTVLSSKNTFQESKEFFSNSKKDVNFFQKIECKNTKNKMLSAKENKKCKKNVLFLHSLEIKELQEKVDSIFWDKIEKNLHLTHFRENILDIKIIPKIEKLIRKKIVVSEKVNFPSKTLTRDEILESKPPVVTIMGHVNHGKTSLLQCICSMEISQKEHGGITQRIGAYHIETKNGTITFLDTPGHSAFSSMRNRGVQITDIVVLVVAADDGVMPQTIESIHNAKKFNIPIIVAINKIDKLNTDTEKIKNELSNYGIISEEWGGENQFVYVSAKSKKGINSLLEAIFLQAEILELKYSKSKTMTGVVIESRIDKGLGPVATILVQDGILNKGDVILCGIEYGKVRAIRNKNGESISSIGPSIPVEIFGLSGIPFAGEKIVVIQNEKKAREMSLYKKNIIREEKLQSKKKEINVENLFKNMNFRKNHSELNLILKSDVQGLIEPIIDTVTKEIKESVFKINIIGSGVGNITETDAMLSIASKAVLIGFNVRVDSSAKKIIKKENLNYRICHTIYQLVDNIKNILNEIISPKVIKRRIGIVEVKDVFSSKSFGAIAGCVVIEGLILKNRDISVFREKKLIYKGKLESLRRFKDNVHEVKAGMECGVVIKNYGDYKIGDIIHVFEN